MDRQRSVIVGYGLLASLAVVTAVIGASYGNGWMESRTSVPAAVPVPTPWVCDGIQEPQRVRIEINATKADLVQQQHLLAKLDPLSRDAVALASQISTEQEWLIRAEPCAKAEGQ